jgi:hypothetical protein
VGDHVGEDMRERWNLDEARQSSPTVQAVQGHKEGIGWPPSSSRHSTSSSTKIEGRLVEMDLVGPCD